MITEHRGIWLALILVLVSSFHACAIADPMQGSTAEEPGETDTSTVIPPLLSPLQLPISTTSMGDHQETLSLPPEAPHGKIAYISSRSGLAEIWLLDLATGSERQLTETDCSNASPGGRPDWYIPGVRGFSWAPDGQRIAYLAMCTSGGSLTHLNLVDLETDRVISISLDHLGPDSYPTWEHSSNRLIFSRQESVYEPVECVYLADLGERGRPKVEVLPGAGWQEEQHQCYCPYRLTWSPNGEYIAYGGPYIGVPGAGSRTYVSVVDIEGTHLTYEPVGTLSPESPLGRSSVWIAEPAMDGFAWSNNSQYLAVATEKGYVFASLFLVEVTDDSAFSRPVLRTEIGPVSELFFSNPVFSPDDRILYFVSVRPDIEDELAPGEYFGSIYSVPVRDLLEDGPRDVQLVTSLDQLTGYPSLSSDGEWFVYAVKVGETVEVWLQAVDGTYRQRLVGDGFVNTRPAWQPK